MQLKLNHMLIVVVMILGFCIFRVTSDVSSLSCSSCGEECTDSCGTRHFRTCCFNYLRKRGGVSTAAGSTGMIHNGLNDASVLPANRIAIHSQELTSIDMDKLMFLLAFMRQNEGKSLEELQAEYFKTLDRSENTKLQIPSYDK